MNTDQANGFVDPRAPGEAGSDAFSFAEKDVLVSEGRGSARDIPIFDGRNGAKISNYFKFDPDFENGILIGLPFSDGGDDIVVGSGPMGRPSAEKSSHVFSGIDLACGLHCDKPISSDIYPDYGALIL